MGRKPLLLKDPNLKDRIAGIIAGGHYAETACGAVGVSESSYYAWLEKGEVARARHDAGMTLGVEETAYLEFTEAVRKAAAAAEARSLKVINDAANDGTWQAAAWYLERRHPHRWGRFDRVEATTTVRTDPIAEAAMENEEVRQAIDDVIARISGEGDTGWPGETD